MKKSLSKIILGTPTEAKNLGKLQAMNTFESAPIHDRLIFLDEEKKKEWDDMPESQKSFVMNHLQSCCDKMESKLAIEMLCNVINDLNIRIKKLETCYKSH